MIIVPQKHREKTIPTLLGLLVAIVGLGSGLFLLRGQLRLNSSASVEETPAEVRISNVNENSFVVSWYTQKAISGYVQYGENGREPDLIVSDERDQQKGEVGSYFTHFVPVRGLKPESTYEFKVGSGTGLFDDMGKTYKVTTAKDLANPPPADVAYGMAMTASGDPADGAIVYVEMAGMAPQAALVKASGSWVIPLSTARSADLGNYVQYDKASTPITLTVQGGSLGKSIIKTNTANDSPVQQITMGQNYTLPESNTGTEEINNTVNKLEITTPTDGQAVNNKGVEIKGQAPPGTEVNVEIHSDEVVSSKVIAGENGQFVFSVPTNLPAGEHTVTISAIVNGVVEKITRSFTVYAAGESGAPFYSATPSATLIPSPIKKISVTPTVKKTPTPKPTLPPREVPVSSDSAIPKTGNEWMTWLLLIAGGVLLSSGMVWYKKTS